MLAILREYVENDIQITEYTKDGETVSHIIRTPVPSEEPITEPPPAMTLEDKINYLYYKGKGVIL